MHKLDTTSEQQILSILNAHHAALRAKDAAQLLAPYTLDAVSFDLAPPLQQVGISTETTAGVEAWFDTWDGPIIESIAQFQATIAEGDDIAYCHGLVNLQGTKKAGGGYEGGPVDLWFRSTWCLRRQNGEWKIAHEHASTPFYMDGSDRACVDLTPEPEFESIS